ncbi:MAG TPA: hypothetical protein P5223_00250, partial [Phycisphaerae bacterium]|nr:hypothetical protein [Phycisphaerae bacterium]
AVSASEAVAMGLIDEVVADAEVLERARQIAGDFAKFSAAALRETKRVFGTLRRVAGDPAAVRHLNSTVSRES